jgi:hypothetical protein
LLVPRVLCYFRSSSSRKTQQQQQQHYYFHSCSRSLPTIATLTTALSPPLPCCCCCCHQPSAQQHTHPTPYETIRNHPKASDSIESLSKTLVKHYQDPSQASHTPSPQHLSFLLALAEQFTHPTRFHHIILHSPTPSSSQLHTHPTPSDTIRNHPKASDSTESLSKTLAKHYQDPSQASHTPSPHHLLHETGFFSGDS